MTWGRDTDEYEARDQFALFMEAGGTLFDTADVYASGAAEELLGSIVAEAGVRDDVVIVTKAGGRRTPERRFDTSRRHLLRALDGSLDRLGTDYVDLWLVHGWDSATPIEETLSAMAAAQDSGKARYVGVSNYAPWQLTLAATTAEHRHGMALVANEVEYSLLARDGEDDVLGAAGAVGVGTAGLVADRPRCPHRQVPARHPRGLPWGLPAPGRVRPGVPRRAAPARRRRRVHRCRGPGRGARGGRCLVGA